MRDTIESHLLRPHCTCTCAELVARVPEAALLELRRERLARLLPLLFDAARKRKEPSLDGFRRLERCRNFALKLVLLRLEQRGEARAAGVELAAGPATHRGNRLRLKRARDAAVGPMRKLNNASSPKCISDAENGGTRRGRGGRTQGAGGKGWKEREVRWGASERGVGDDGDALFHFENAHRRALRTLFLAPTDKDVHGHAHLESGRGGREDTEGNGLPPTTPASPPAAAN